MKTRLSTVLVLLGMACVLYYAAQTVVVWSYQQKAIASLAGSASPGAHASARPVRAARLRAGDPIGQIVVPRLGLSAAVAEGDDDGTLKKAVGHLPDTPMPWDRWGNVGLAGHRDGLFRKLEGISVGDDILVRTAQGDYFYRVTKTHIVDPDDVWVLNAAATPTLTLITCYPFSFIGNAPRRFIVHADLVGHVGGAAVTGKAI